MGRPPKAAPLCSLFLLIYFFILWIFMVIPQIFFIYSRYIYIYIYVLNIFHVFSFVCFVIYSINSRSGHDRSQTFGSISHVSGPYGSIWRNFDWIRHHLIRIWPSNAKVIYIYIYIYNYIYIYMYIYIDIRITKLFLYKTKFV